METPEGAPIVQGTCTACDEILDGHIIDGLLCGCDATKCSRAGTLALAFGPGGIKVAHTVDEVVPISELIKAAEVLCSAVCGFSASKKLAVRIGKAVLIFSSSRIRASYVAYGLCSE
jgi:acetylornithine deacetylase/succinyl-diaminopimelate desuccinylase-like protein